MVMIGGTGGPFFGGPSANASNSSAGLPFAGVPDELREGAARVLATEPEHDLPEIDWDPAERPGAQTLRRLLAPARARIAIAEMLMVNDPVLCNGGRLARTGRVAERVLERLRIRVFSHLQRQSVDFFTRERSGVLLSRMTSDVDALSALLQEGYVNLVVQGLTVVLVTAVLIGISPTLAGLLLLVVVPVFVALTWWFRGASTTAFGRVRDRIADVLSDLQEHLAGIRIVTASNRRRHNDVVHREVVGRYRQASLDGVRVSSTYGPAAEVTGLLGQAAVLLIGGRLVLDGSLTIGELTAFVLYLTTFFAPIQQLVQLYTVYQQGAAALHKLDEVLTTEPSVVERHDATELAPIDGRIELDDVTFAYGDEPPVLHDVSLTIRPGETVALVGPRQRPAGTVPVPRHPPRQRRIRPARRLRRRAARRVRGGRSLRPGRSPRRRARRGGPRARCLTERG